ncbi:glycosyl hydrolase [Arthrobacter sp. YD4]|uniref:glycosyl hydrolase n=1 Tax=Arthrobacter sp. YD4 TaxID=3058043 RepID=UPI0025B44C5E|nr:glycosyl hydrolase [Arthrobacter sp. YD4]MDN3935664.1 glycosyl hydrolase [Arthrobacter sp. YD4]
MKPLKALAAALAFAVAGLALGVVPAHAASASVSLSPASGPAGTSITVTGTGFPKKSSGTLTAGASSSTFKVSTSGYFTADVVMPQSSDTVVTVKATSGTVAASAVFTVTAAQPAPVAITTAPLRFGVGTPGGPLASAELDQVGTLTGEAPSVILSYKDFNQAPPITELDAVRSRGAVTLLTWEPWAWGGGTIQPAFALNRITAGNFDPYLQQWGTALAAWGHPVMLRFGHEMNGNWYPWAEGVNGNAAGDYAAAWRHVHNVLATTGATNITWVWNPNIPYFGSTTLDGLYPGAGYVDAVALDGYNWGTSTAGTSWTSPSDLFAPGLAELRRLAAGKQILIAEASSAEQGGSKADWNTALISYLAAQTDVTAVVWFDFNKETDWRIDSSTSSATALATALAARPR